MPPLSTATYAHSECRTKKYPFSQIWWKHLNLNFRWKCTINFQRVARSMLARRMVLRMKIAIENEDDNDRLSKSYVHSPVRAVPS